MSIEKRQLARLIYEIWGAIDRYEGLGRIGLPSWSESQASDRELIYRLIADFQASGDIGEEVMAKMGLLQARLAANICRHYVDDIRED